ncbi:MAG: type I restriction-modification enzyme R subunit C-terminal domain-containing protein [Chloroflexota bacterium]
MKGTDDRRKERCFTITALQKAHQVAYNKALVDIISMIRHALKDEPLKTVEERVDAAIARITAPRSPMNSSGSLASAITSSRTSPSSRRISLTAPRAMRS